MKIRIDNFRGRAPRVSPRALAEGYGQIADSPRLLSGDLESWQERSQVGTLPKGATINTIYRLASRTGDDTPFWLHWTPAELAAGETNVDVALGPIPADTAVSTFFTGTSLGPRYTTKFLATDPSQQGLALTGAYPYASLPLGVPAPTLAPTVTQMIPEIVPGSESFTFDGSDISGWQIGDPQEPEFNDGLRQRNWGVDSAPGSANGANGTGNPIPSFVGLLARGFRILLRRDFRLDEAAAFNYQAEFNFDNAGSGTYGFRFRFLSSLTAGPNIYFGFSGGGAGMVTFFEGTGSQQSYPLVLPRLTWHTVQVMAQLREDGYYGITVNVKQSATVLLSFTGRAQNLGGELGFEIVSDGGQTPRRAWVDNIMGAITSTPPAQPVPVFTNYVYTIVNNQGQESPPSPPSMAVTVDNGIVNSVTIPAQTITDIDVIRLYRASSSTTEAQYLFVADVPLPLPATYMDAAMSSDIGPDALITTDFDPPPAALRGINSVAGGALVGFAMNQLCFSEPEYPYAWPVRYRLTTDYNIVAIAVLNATIVVFTEAFYQLASGNAPGDYAMERQTYPQGCASKRSIAYITGGILFASPDGLYLVSGSGAPINTTELLFSRREWQALNPASIIGVAHDDRYFGFYVRTDDTRGGFILDFRQGGFGLIDIFDHATAVYADPITYTLYMVVDDDIPPGPFLLIDADNFLRI